MKDGQYDLAQTPRSGIDIRALLAELEQDPSSWEGLHPDTVVGHVHLHVADLGSTREFYHQTLGLGVTMMSEEFGALFYERRRVSPPTSGPTSGSARAWPPAPADRQACVTLRSWFPTMMSSIVLWPGSMRRRSCTSLPTTAFL